MPKFKLRGVMSKEVTATIEAVSITEAMIIMGDTMRKTNAGYNLTISEMEATRIEDKTGGE